MFDGRSELLDKIEQATPALRQYIAEQIDDAQAWVLQFVTWYNEEHKHSSLKFVTPNQRHNGLATRICEKCRELYLLSQAATS